MREKQSNRGRLPLILATVGLSGLIWLDIYAQGAGGHVDVQTKHTDRDLGWNRGAWGAWRLGRRIGKDPQFPKKPDVKQGPCVPGTETVTVSAAYPTGEKSTSMILLEKVFPSQVGLGEPFDYQIKVTNLTDLDVDDVVVKDSLPANYKLESSTPKTSSVAGGDAQWALGSLAPRASKTINVKGTATSVATLNSCAEVTYKSALCSAIKVVEPKLKLVQSAPPEVILCDLIPIKVTVSNPGTGHLENGKVTVQLPAGLKTVDGKSSVILDAGTLCAGDSKDFTINAKADKAGKYVAKSTATAGALKADSNATTTTVTEPVLTIEQTCPGKILLGRTITNKIRVGNTGTASSANTVVEATVPLNATFVSASAGGVLTAGTVVWNLGSLAPKASKEVSFVMSPVGKTTVESKSSVKGVCAAAKTDSCKTEVLGIPAILLEVIDVSDPIEVGKDETYIITATNQGTADGTNIKIVVTLEDSMNYVSSEGATKGTAKAKVVEFAPLPRLAPKVKATWKVVTKATKAADARFKVSMTSDQLERPVEETESTHLYQ